MPPPRSINIGPYSFSVTSGYSDGVFEVGPAELEVLDGARAERIRKKAHKVLEKIRARSGRRTLTEGELRLLTTTVAEIDAELRLERIPDPRGSDAGGRTMRRAVEFAPGGEPDFTGGEFDAEVARLAELRVTSEETARGLTLTPPQRDAAIAALREDPLIREAARARVEVALRERERMLTELF